MNIKKISEKFSDGEPLNDEELESFIEHMEGLFSMLNSLGREYRMVRTHVAMQLNAAKEFQFHRKNG